MDKTFVGTLFPKVKSKFFESVEKDGCFDTPFSLFEENNVHLRHGTIST
jgi:hypothetical protein